MKIVTYHSEDAQPDSRWIAYYEVKITPSKSKNPAERSPEAVNPDHEKIGLGKPDRFGYLPLRFSASTKEEAVRLADEHWKQALHKLDDQREAVAFNARKLSEQAAAKRAAQ